MIAAQFKAAQFAIAKDAVPRDAYAMLDEGCQLLYFFVQVLPYFFYFLLKNLIKVDASYSAYAQFISVTSITGRSIASQSVSTIHLQDQIEGHGR